MPTGCLICISFELTSLVLLPFWQIFVFLYLISAWRSANPWPPSSAVTARPSLSPLSASDLVSEDRVCMCVCMCVSVSRTLKWWQHPIKKQAESSPIDCPLNQLRQWDGHPNQGPDPETSERLYTRSHITHNMHAHKYTHTHTHKYTLSHINTNTIHTHT